MSHAQWPTLTALRLRLLATLVAAPAAAYGKRDQDLRAAEGMPAACALYDGSRLCPLLHDSRACVLRSRQGSCSMQTNLQCSLATPQACSLSVWPAFSQTVVPVQMSGHAAPPCHPLRVQASRWTASAACAGLRDQTPPLSSLACPLYRHLGTGFVVVGALAGPTAWAEGTWRQCQAQGHTRTAAD